MKTFRRHIAVAISTCFYLTYLPGRFRRGTYYTGAGLIGSLVGLASARALPAASFQQLCFLLGAALFSVVMSDWAETALGTHDDPRIVIDEWVGMLWTVAFLPKNLAFGISGFILFRVFDIWKPGPVRQMGKLPGGWGIVADDLLAGVLANAVLQLVHCCL